MPSSSIQANDAPYAALARAGRSPPSVVVPPIWPTNWPCLSLEHFQVWENVQQQRLRHQDDRLDELTARVTRQDATNERQDAKIGRLDETLVTIQLETRALQQRMEVVLAQFTLALPPVLPATDTVTVK
eukprot:CAMPEP_0171979314 /NCGR_PEP_ID=MMETSP0993-20121228/256246_1 /TAXON_ID=483369 /ORGANISM="non described non described, Strain CCMP2098" /LENGTH=128 /DNA_ID=CAMNT_0012631393 /DNA_START=94 /DNA_END=477 /DNA_ORIENTATION=-